MARAWLVLVLAAWLGAPAAAARPRVAILDSGVDLAHPALAGHLVRGHDFVDGDSVPNDVLGHGTVMAAIVLACEGEPGRTRDCDVMPLKVAEATGDERRGAVPAERLARAIRFAAARGASVILVGSGSAGLDPAVAGAIALAESRGIPVVAPAGSAEDGAMLYPAALPTVISAAGDEPIATRATAVACDEFVVAGPREGEAVLCRGSSVAAARVAGLVAGLLSRRPELTPAGVRNLLRATEATSEPPDEAPRAAPPAAGPDATLGWLQYADRAGTDIVMDAPWRSVRDYIPVLFFFPQFEGGRRVERIRILECVAGVPVSPAVVVDAAGGPDTLNGATFVGPMGEPREGLAADERVSNFWHYIVRVPHAALAHHATPDVHELRAEVEWTRPGALGRQRMRNFRVLRVVVDARQFPSFAPEDHYFDTHVHTIAEQTTSGFLNVNGAAKAYGGPVVMLLETAYALGLVQAQPGGGNWTAYRDSIAVTDHNMFYSRRPYDTGAAPLFGPTATTDGHAGEAAWYRANLGTLAGEEITLRRGSNQDGKIAPNLGHHLLAYGAPHVEGPWHGGLFLTSRLENPNTFESVLGAIKAADSGGFVYASHPNLRGFIWPPEYFAQGIGLPPWDSVSGPGVDSTRGEFLFKGSEVWNTKLDLVARDNGHLSASSAFDAMNPFPGGPAAQRFQTVAWDDELVRSLDTWFGQVGQGLGYAFREAPGEKFIRKLYASAGSDAHGDYNYSDEVPATAVPWSGLLHGNAFARVRTYALAHERPAGTRDALDAFRDGNTVITDGPLVTWSLDADARHDPGAGAARWHDATSAWQNEDGGIGGEGRFDGGRTVLVPLPGDGVWLRSRWMRSTTPGAADITRLHLDRVSASARDSFEVLTGPEGAPDPRALPRAMDRLAALVATARDSGTGERCITNPIWVAPVRIEVQAQAAAASAGSPPACPPRGLRVTFEFPFSMSAAAGARAFVRPLDARGNSTDPAIELVPDPGWEAVNGAVAARYSVTNAGSLPIPPGDWDAVSHASVPGARSYVVYLTSPTELHGNVLNDIGRAFVWPVATPREQRGR